MNLTGLTFDYVSLNEPDSIYERAINKAGGQIYIIERSVKNIGHYWLKLHSLIKRNKYDAVHIHGNSHTVVLELTAARLAGCVVGMVHAHNTTCKHVVAHILLSPLFTLLCTHRFACGDKAGKFMYGTTPFVVINNGVDIEKFSFMPQKRCVLREKYGFNGKKVIGHVGSFTKVKNQAFIIDVFNDLLKKSSDYRLVLIGDGPLKNDVILKARSMGILDNILFTGNIDNVYDYLNAIDIIVMPSFFEGLPLSLIEQQTTGLQCVVSDVITKEADKTGNLFFLSLSDKSSKWAQIIDSIDCSDRKLRSIRAEKDIIEAGYSIKSEAEKLREYYLSCK
jgi:glycosyltransferase involved in cell wall biosynthesis